MRLFISYARADKAVATALVGDADSLGHTAFYDAELTGGQRWWDALLDQIEGSEVFVPVLSDDYRGSEACRAEAAWALAQGIPFLPVAPTPQSPGLYDPVIAEANWVVYDPASRESLALLARSLASIPPPAPPAETPVRPAIPVSYMNALEQQVRGVGEISRGDQLALVSDLRARLSTRDEAVARTLLGSLRSRPEITFEAASAIDALMGDDPPPVPAPVRTRSEPGRRVAPAATDAEPAASAGDLPRLPRPVSGVLVSLATLMWVVAVTMLPWAPYRLDRGSPVLRPRLWESANIVPDNAAIFAVVVAVVVTGLTVLAVFVRLPLLARVGVATLGVVVAIVAATKTTMTSLAVSGGSGVWVYLVAMLALAVAVLFSSP